MCGIAGYISAQTHVDLATALRAMAAAMVHRGPDDEGFFETATRAGTHRVGLAHRRLSIIDLAAGHQPLGNEDGSVQIVFNGEVYNFQALRTELEANGHRFATHSDTETIVHAYEQWGDDCVMRFRGMFAFAIWDAPKQRLLLARDRFGKKPLFLTESDGNLLFASEIKSLLAFPGQSAHVDMTAVWDYLAYRYVPAPATLFSGIRKLMPGSLAVWEKGTMIERRYYQPPDQLPFQETAMPSDPVGAFLEKLDESVSIRMVSDVPFGAFLSGGIDSSAIVGLMSRHSSTPVKTFSVGFSESAYSELGYARTIAEQFKTDHHELTVSQQHLMQHLAALVRFRDAPVAEPSDIPIYLLAQEARKTVKMVLTGEGSDEFLGGYPKHIFEHYAQPYQLLPKIIRHGLIEPLTAALPYRFSRARTALVNLGLDCFEERMPRWFGALSPQERKHLAAFLPTTNTADGVQFDTTADNSPLRRILYFDQTSWLPDNLLERGDRMTMAASLEARMPFMDHELAALVSGLPDTYRLRGKTSKWILREAMKRLLPAEILKRPKVGFRVPVNQWFRVGMRDYLYDHLAAPESHTAVYYHRPALLKLLEEHTKGHKNHEKVLWCLLNLEVWHRCYF
ncbi:MAG: asparagine synthase (glutamine-hydrolyzing) [Methylobacter sp.]|uniref:asparagine synthase (glutamine-hydrolyzing) n=1 Tax=Methylicorpusculum sp. TaxID=2713644 RepID=UPI0027302EE5|nr:asparagine synthase (glutamine-hydrolyzing) [Methylicorpusculum sp.]MDP2429631.1 asparagine synthase (glutamine-hydrolyzing) [Methylobacter sp.]MDP2178433.1 asparagine synthase (glutamine-hydrolyzing) [Methylicorpusculum sp.]MDP3053923.1 asparagine synthase (glutamine-hydrolyzing) [Methylobacter sp.]MDP3360634.1 asparagine synthase (glutamine-hydrolyzing) [Methylobacter sp.]MDZ4218311.1 asparagine synthase (glutamine-hydrolyzing) [Methylobacter sp.]